MTHTPFVTTGRQRKYQFPNGYGASVISDGYGNENGLFELGVLKDGHLTYQTPITDDVLGYLTEDEVQQRLDEIAALTDEAVIRHQIERETAKRDQRIADLRAELASLESEQSPIVNSTPAQSETPLAVIHRTARIHQAQYRAERALDAVRSSAWSAGSHALMECPREERFAHDLTAAVAELVQLALGVEDPS